MNLMSVDLGIHKVAIAVFIGSSDNIEVVRYDNSDEERRWMQLANLAHFAHDIANLHDIDVIWVEKPIIGNNRKYSMELAETYGAVLSACARLAVPIHSVDNNTWKKEVVGNGHASKDEIRNYIDVTHGAYAPVCEGDQDAYDAACIGLYGFGVLDRAKELSLES